MKYHLAIDKGFVYKNDERYIPLKLQNINERLAKDKNLNAICAFTMEFENEQLLKEFLIHEGILKEELTKYDLAIIYKRNYIHMLKVPLSKDKKYFKMGNLIDIITKNSLDQTFLRAFLNYFRNDTYMPEEYYELKRTLYNPVPEYVLLDRVTAFVNRLCYPGKDGIRYKAFYDLAMYTGTLVEERERKQPQDNLSSSKLLSEEQQFHLDELLERKEELEKEEIDGQISLFHM
jgi:hypothetical protein